jgi:hypothetical protein
VRKDGIGLALSSSLANEKERTTGRQVILEELAKSIPNILTAHLITETAFHTGLA